MSDNRPVPWPWALRFEGTDAFPPSISDLPVLIKDLINRPCRIILPDSVVTEDWVPDRVNIFVDATNRVTDIRFG